MQIVIDMDEELYKRIKKNCYIYEEEVESVAFSIIGGATLPKGHGRLGDLGKVYDKLNEAQIEGTEEYKSLGEAKQIICEAPTIIEADKESEE